MGTFITAPQRINDTSRNLPLGMPAELRPDFTRSSPLKPTTPCRACSKANGWDDADGLCFDCYQARERVGYAEKESDEIRAEIDQRVSEDLRDVVGISKRELRAEWSKVPKALKDAMPKAILRALSAGQVPAKGFGLGADTGSGKTMSLAAIIRGFQKAYRLDYAMRLVTETRQHPDDPPKFKHQAVWLTWPEAVSNIRLHAIDGGAERILDRAESAALLILDDLGRERIKGAYVDDFAASQLDRIVNHRYREELPTLWTTNLPEIELTAIYGAALVSRLTEDSPLIWLDGLQSMRICV